MAIASLTELEPGSTLVDDLVEDASHEEERITGLSFDHCEFRGCVLQGVKFESCEFVDCSFEDCDLSNAGWRESRIAGGEFRGCKLLGVDWTQANWRSAGLHGPPSFDNSRLTDSFAAGIPWVNIEFSDCQMDRMDFAEADLSGASFEGCDLQGARFDHAKLDKADFRKAHDYAIDIRTASITGAKFDLPAAIGLLNGLPIELE